MSDRVQVPQRAAIPKEDYLSTGSTLLNLACSGMPDCGLTKGRYFWMVGDSSSGKTFLMLTCFAEACRNKNWDKYDLIFDDVEDGALMNFERYFGAKMAGRVQPPRGTRAEPIYSEKAEDFYFWLDDRLTLVEKGKAPPFLALLDSMDALSTKYEQKKFQERKTAARSETKVEAKGDYGDGKAKINSTWIRSVVSRLRDTGSTLIILSQTRDNVDGGMFEPDSVASGGRALKFYAAWQLWSTCGPKLKKSISGTDRQVGITSRITVKKNRLTGKEWTVEIPIYHSYGIDDLGSCVDFLIKEKRWRVPKQSSSVFAPDFDFEGSREDLIKKIEDEDLQFDLRSIVTEVWKEIEEKCQLERKPRYE